MIFSDVERIVLGRNIIHVSIICKILSRTKGVMRIVEDFRQRPQRSTSVVGSRRNVEDCDHETEDCGYQGEEATAEENGDVPVDVPTSPSEETCHERYQTRNKQNRTLQGQGEGAQKEGQRSEAKVNQGQAADSRRRVTTL